MTSEQSYLHSMVIIDAPWIVPQGISSLLSCKVKNYDRMGVGIMDVPVFLIETSQWVKFIS